MRPEMQEEQPRLIFQHMIMQGGDLDVVLAQHAQDGIHFLCRRVRRSPVIAALPPPVG